MTGTDSIGTDSTGTATEPGIASEPGIAVVIASTRRGRIGPTIASWMYRQAEQYAGVRSELLDVADAGFPYGLDTEQELSEEAVAFSGRLAAADGFVIVTPEYNHSFPASLKHVLDYTGQAWAAKPVAFVSYGGIGGGLRAVEQLRLVCAELRATTIRETLSIHNFWEHLDADGALNNDKGREAAAQAVLDELSWWARALRTARTAEPYPTS